MICVKRVRAGAQSDTDNDAGEARRFEDVAGVDMCECSNTDFPISGAS